MTDTAKPLALITGVGPARALALARRFAEGTIAWRCWRATPIAFRRWSGRSRTRSRCRATSAMRQRWSERSRRSATRKWSSTTRSAARLAPSSRSKRDAPAQLRDQHDGAVPPCSTHSTGDGGRRRSAIIVTGNTSAQRGKANFAGFAPRPRQRSASSPNRSHAISGPKASTSPTSSSTR